MNRFKKDPHYLLKYCVKTIILLASINIVLYSLKGLSFEFTYESWMFILPFISLLLCGLPSSVLHNCAHGNVGPLKINHLIGEMLGTFMLYGYGGFRLGHMFHHKYPDNPKYDPHPPKGHSFSASLVSPIKATLDVIERVYYENFGDSKSTQLNISTQKVLFNIGVILRVSFWFLLFGAEVFLIFYIPTYILNIFVFAHINYAAHIENEDGSSEIINLDHNYYYKIVNIISFGGYFHKNHHRKPQAFNPAKVIIEEDLAYITYRPSSASEKLVEKEKDSPFTLPLFGMERI